MASAVGALLLAASPAAADTFTVTGTDDVTGSCTGDQCTSIRAAVAAADANGASDEIVLPAGSYGLQGALTITTPVTLRGAGARNTTLYQAGTARVLEINGVTATITGLTVSNGTATDAAGYFGGNIAARQATVLLDHVRVTAGHASSGGGLTNRNGTMTITNSLIDHNAADTGGGDGGGVLNFGGDGLGPATMTISNSTIAFNSARGDGALNAYGNDDDHLTLQNTTVAFNTGSDRGTGGINVGQGTYTAGNTLIASNTVYGTEVNCSGLAPTTDAGANLDSGTSCGFSAPSDRTGVDPRLDTQLRDYGGQTDALGFPIDSPAVDIGGICAATDQTDFARGGPCDAGAWENRDAVPAPTPTPTPTATPVVTAIPTPTVTPVTNKSVEVGSADGVLVKLKGAKTFTRLRDAVIPNGSEVDVTTGEVTVTTQSGERATFYGGRFVISQSGGITTLTLSEKLTGCPKAKQSSASAAASKPKTRKLWGDGKGKFRTKGQYSAATIRGTRWLVTDTCTTTVTKVADGVVNVRDDVLRKTVAVRKGKSYTARAKR